MRITAAAMQKDGIVYIGFRHSEILKTVKRLVTFKQPIRMGFLTDTGLFVDRFEGAWIAFKAGQIKDYQEGDILISEQLW